MMGLFSHVTSVHILSKRPHRFLLPRGKTLCGTQDRAHTRLSNLGLIPHLKTKEHLVLRRLCAVLYGCPSAQGLNWASSKDNEWPGLCSETCFFQDHRWKPPLQPCTDSPQYGNPSSRKWNENMKYDLTQYQSLLLVDGTIDYLFSVV